MNENDFSKKFASYLDVSAANVSADTASRLAKVRQQALAAYQPPVRILGLVTVSGQMTDPSYVARKPVFWLGVLGLATAVWALQPPAATDDLYDEAGVVDAKLLTGELPIDAFLDKDFATWVQEQEAAPQ
jgi:hypothetical protein